MASSSTADNPPLAIATRLHLGYASHPPPTSQLFATLSSFARLASTIGADHAVVAVDAEEKLEGYDLVEEVTKICNALNDGGSGGGSGSGSSSSSVECSTDNGSSSEEKIVRPPAPSLHVPIHVLPVTPWGKFAPALNAIVGWCARAGAQYLLFASAEVQLTRSVMEAMKRNLNFENTLVVGAALQGHEYKTSVSEREIEVELTGRTVPWNTCAVWNVPKLALTGFLLVSEGLHPFDDGREGSSGVEEACAVATLQRILTPERARAKLVSMPGTSWGQDFGNDEKRKEWHERKMMSKYTRAKRQLDLLGLSGVVIHC